MFTKQDSTIQLFSFFPSHFQFINTCLCCSWTASILYDVRNSFHLLQSVVVHEAQPGYALIIKYKILQRIQQNVKSYSFSQSTMRTPRLHGLCALSNKLAESYLPPLHLWGGKCFIDKANSIVVPMGASYPSLVKGSHQRCGVWGLWRNPSFMWLVAGGLHF